MLSKTIFDIQQYSESKINKFYENRRHRKKNNVGN